MTKIYDFFQNAENACKITSIGNAYDLLNRAKNDTRAILELYNMEVQGLDDLMESELYSLHNALVRIKYFNQTGKVLADLQFKK